MNILNPEEHSRQIKAYKAELPHYDTYAEALKRVFAKAFPLAVVQARSKTVSSFAEKAVRKGDRYPDAVHMLTDLCGARVIVQTLEQVSTVRNFIEASFTVVEFDDKAKSLNEDEFGYRDIHYIVQLREDRDLGLTAEEAEAIGERKAELQVRTVLQHGWADILHDRIYKTVISVPSEWRREANRLAALLEKADESFGQLADALDSQTSSYDVFLPKSKLLSEAEVLKTILALEENANQRSSLSLKLAKVLVAANLWEEAVRVLNDHPQDTPEFRLELGHALCCANRHAPNSQPFKKGLKLLAAVALPGEPCVTPDPYAPSVTAERIQPGLRAKALFRLGSTYALHGQSSANALKLFQNAHALRPDNPYYHVAYVQAEFCEHNDRTLLPLVANALRKDIERFRHHLTLGIETPNALFAIARCRLLLGETSPCLCAFAKVVEVVLQKDSRVPAKVLDDEITTVQQLCGINATLAEQALVLLHLARWRACPQNELSGAARESRAWLEQRRKHRKPFKAPVLFVIGGAELMPRRKVQGYFTYLFEALEFFDGTVISGGTTSGIPGMVGDVTKTLAQQRSKRFDLITYLPRRLPRDASVHPSYQVVGRTSGNEFSEQELIACWADLLLSGASPEKITALGINGGRIADFEYRLALAFGASVGVMRESGRAAAVLLADPDWNKHSRLCVIPEDKIVVWAFVNRHNTLSLSSEEIGAAAPDAHEFYRQHRWEKGETSDGALKPWNKLDSKLQNSNREQIAFIENVLKKQGFRLVRSQTPKVIRFRTQEIEEMAEREHARWIVERTGEGWVYGKIKDIDAKISPSLVSWADVPEHVRAFDREAVSLFPTLLAKLGYEVQRPDDSSN